MISRNFHKIMGLPRSPPYVIYNILQSIDDATMKLM